MADTSRIEELRRRVQKDPASIAFAQLAEEYRRAGRFDEAVATCESGLAHHPGYLSARVTLGRSLLETGQLDAAQLELKQVLRAAPENLAALRGLAEIHHRRGELDEALAHYRTALEFARHDPELEHLVEQIALELEPRPAMPPVVDGLSFEEVKDAFLNLSIDADAGVETEPAGGDMATPAGEWPSEGQEPAAAPDQPAAVEPIGATRPEHASEATVVPAALTLTGVVPPVEPAEEPVVPVQAEGAPICAADGPDPAPGEAAAETLSTLEQPVAPVDLEPLAWPVQAAEEEWMTTATPVAAVEEALPAPEMTPAVSALPRAEAGARVDALQRWLETILAERQRRG